MRYNAPNPPPNQMRDFFVRGGIPVTMTLLAISIAVFLASFFSSETLKPFLLTYVGFVPENVWLRPWTLFTYPLFHMGFLELLIGGSFFWLAGGSLERSWGSRRFTIFFFALTFISAVSLQLGVYLFSRTSLPQFLALPPLVFLSGFSLPLGGMIVAFCMLNPNLTLMFYFFPVRAIYVAWIVALLTYFSGGMGPVLNLFACGGIIAAFLYVKFGRAWGEIGSYSSRRAPPRGPDLRIYPKAANSSFRTMDGSPRRGALDVAGRLKDWRERRRLERLFKNSGFSESESDWREDEKKRP